MIEVLHELGVAGAVEGGAHSVDMLSSALQGRADFNVKLTWDFVGAQQRGLDTGEVDAFRTQETKQHKAAAYGRTEARVIGAPHPSEASVAASRGHSPPVLRRARSGGRRPTTSDDALARIRESTSTVCRLASAAPPPRPAAAAAGAGDATGDDAGALELLLLGAEACCRCGCGWPKAGGSVSTGIQSNASSGNEAGAGFSRGAAALAGRAPRDKASSNSRGAGVARTAPAPIG